MENVEPNDEMEKEINKGETYRIEDTVDNSQLSVVVTVEEEEEAIFANIPNEVWSAIEFVEIRTTEAVVYEYVSDCVDNAIKETNISEDVRKLNTKQSVVMGDIEKFS